MPRGHRIHIGSGALSVGLRLGAVYLNISRNGGPHYAADTSDHQRATNRSVAILYPKLAKTHGQTVTYEDKPSAHLKVEYGFDVDQVAEGNYAPESYHDFIGIRFCDKICILH